MYQHYDNDTFFKAVHWAKRNIRKGKSRLNTYKAAERYYGVDADKIQNYLLKYEKDFMSIDYRKFTNYTVEQYYFNEFKEYVDKLEDYVDKLEDALDEQNEYIDNLENDLDELKGYVNKLENYLDCNW